MFRRWMRSIKCRDEDGDDETEIHLVVGTATKVTHCKVVNDVDLKGCIFRQIRDFKLLRKSDWSILAYPHL